MSVIETFAQISQTITKMIRFCIEDTSIKTDFDEFSNKLTKMAKDGEDNFDELVLSFITSGRIGETKQSFSNYYMEKTPSLTDEEKNIVKSMGQAIVSFFEIKKILKNSFNLYNLINEKEYSVMPLVKMTHFRGVYAGQYMLGMIIKLNGEYFLISIKEIYSKFEKNYVKRLAVAMLINSPMSSYIDNDERIEKMPQIIEKSAEEFFKCFGTDEIITTNTYADNLIELFDEYTQGNITDEEKKEYTENIPQPEQYRYFEVKSLNINSNDFIEKSLDGFSANEESYDVGIIFDKELGLYIIPFYGTLSKIFEIENYKEIEGYKKCLTSFLENNSFPHNIIYRLAHKYPNFMKTVNEILDKQFTVDELVKYYKYEYLEQKLYSATTVLYDSKLFKNIIETIDSGNQQASDELNLQTVQPVGRNEPCPCGSGKKYKKCCMNKINQ